jgi:hypothetical protein
VARDSERLAPSGNEARSFPRRADQTRANACERSWLAVRNDFRAGVTVFDAGVYPPTRPCDEQHKDKWSQAAAPGAEPSGPRYKVLDL